jgi:hypothetical protein
VSSVNTLNICLGHRAFPDEFQDYVDVMLTPDLVVGPKQVIVVSDLYHGTHGSALSEYSQLLWLYDNFDKVVAGYEYVRVFQYRRFVTREYFGPQSQIVIANIGSHPQVVIGNWIQPGDLSMYRGDFTRFSSGELVNRPFKFESGMLGQYVESHVFLEDILNFAKYLMERNILTPRSTARFLSASILIPACNMGVFRSSNLRRILGMLRLAAGFLDTEHFIPRTGYQRRSLGFILERFNSFVLQEFIENGTLEANFGLHVLISDGANLDREYNGIPAGLCANRAEPAVRKPEQIRHDCAAKLKPVQTSKELTAILGRLLGETWTSPRIVELRIVPDHRLILRMEGGSDLVATEMEVLHNIHGIANVAKLDEDELGYLLAQIAKIREPR